MKFRIGKIVLLVAVFALATSVAGFAVPCGVANQITCLDWDGTGTLFASQFDPNFFLDFATVYQQFTLPTPPVWGAWDVESFHFVGGYFNGSTPPFASQFLLELFRNDAGGSAPGSLLAYGYFSSFNEQLISGQIYSYDLYFQSFDMAPGTYWAAVVPYLPFPPQWGWATATGGTGTGGYQCFFQSCGLTGTNFAFAVDGKPVPEPGTLIMLGTGILGLAGSLRRKLL